jgi:hypothetical protein
MIFISHYYRTYTDNYFLRFSYLKNAIFQSLSARKMTSQKYEFSD